MDNGIQLQMKGLELSRMYFEQVGKPALQDAFPEDYDKMAFGMVGEGSECFGFDDRISTDHDYGAAFCIWMPQELFDRIGSQVNRVYETLPKNFTIQASQIQRAQNRGRHGAHSIEQFYGQFLGCKGLPETNMEWMRVPQKYLAVATNGVVFEDPSGAFSAIRGKLLEYYPEDVRRKKIAACAITMAHYGQCNYSRMMRRGQIVAAHMAVDKFIHATIQMTYLLNKKYAPYYKWMWAGMETLEVLPDIKTLLREIVEAGLKESWYETDSWDAYQYRLNTNDPVVVNIEKICTMVREEMARQGLSNHPSDYLEAHAYVIQGGITDPQIRNLSVFMGEE